MAYEKLGKWVIRIVATIPLSGIGILLKTWVFDENPSGEPLWLFWILIILCIAVGLQGIFITFLAEDIREKRKPRPKVSPAKSDHASDPIFTPCGNIEITRMYEAEGTRMINIGCKANAFDYQGCPQGCPYYYVPKPTPAGLAGGAAAGGIIGAAAAGPGGAVIGALIGAVVGGALENQRVKSPLQQEIDRIERQGKPYQIHFQYP